LGRRRRGRRWMTAIAEGGRKSDCHTESVLEKEEERKEMDDCHGGGWEKE